MKKIDKTRIKKSIIYFIISGIICYFFPPIIIFNQNTVIKILVLAGVTLITDNLKIFWKKDKRLTSNIVGALLAYQFGIEYFVPFSIFLFFIFEEYSLIRRIYRMIFYFVSYYPAALLGYQFEGILGIFIFLTLSKLFNSVQIGSEPKIFFIEYMFYLSFLPVYYVYSFNSDNIVKLISIFFGLAFTVFYYLIIKYLNERRREEFKNEKLKKYNQLIFDFSKMLGDISIKHNMHKILEETGNYISKELGYSVIVVSLINRSSGYLERVFFYGVEEEEIERINSTKTSINSILKLFDDKYKYMETYFVPKAAPDEFTYYAKSELYNINPDEKSHWDPDDFLLVSLRGKDDEIIGYLSLDAPVNGLRPDKEELTILSVITRITSILLNGSDDYYKVLKIANTDGLTGLYNHTKLYNDIESGLFEKEEIVSLVFLDMDNFKTINDTKGHTYGDEILRILSSVLVKTMALNDLAYRYGGDEFVIVMKGKSKVQAKIFLEKYYKILKETTSENISFSVGISDTNETKDIKELIEISDKRAYLSKNTGKGRIVIS